MNEEMTIKDKIMRVMELALTINPPEIDDIGQKRTAVFVDWMPHTNTLKVEIYDGGWNKTRSLRELYTIYVSWKDREEELNQLIDRLEAIAKENEE